MGNKLRNFRLNENPTSTSYTNNMNEMVAQIKRANNIKLKVKGGTGGSKPNPKGHTLQVNIPKSKSVKAGDTTQYAIVITAPEYDNPVRDNYVVQKASVIADVWTGDGDDITIERALGYEGYAVAAEDIRNWAPWYLTDSIVKIVFRFDEQAGVDKWFVDMPMMFHGSESQSSIRFSEAGGFTQAVWA